MSTVNRLNHFVNRGRNLFSCGVEFGSNGVDNNIVVQSVDNLLARNVSHSKFSLLWLSDTRLLFQDAEGWCFNPPFVGPRVFENIVGCIRLGRFCLTVTNIHLRPMGASVTAER